MRGRVHWFDAERGLGDIAPDGAGELVPFHCTQIADGSRIIVEGAVVSYELLAKLGRWEATAIATVAG